MCMKKMFIVLLLVPMVNAESQQYECKIGQFDGIPLIINEELESIKFVNLVFKYDWTEHFNGFSAKSKIAEEPLHSTFTVKNFESVRWFKNNKIILLTNTSNKTSAYICE